MFPSTRATWSEDATSVDWVTFRELATTLKPRSTSAFTMPAPMPCEAPVTMAVFRVLLMVLSLEDVLSLVVAGGVSASTPATSGCLLAVSGLDLLPLQIASHRRNVLHVSARSAGAPRRTRATCQCRARPP